VSAEGRELPVVAVDAMGGDVGPPAIVPGVLAALREDRELQVSLYGDEQAIGQELARLEAKPDERLRIVHCTQRIEMGESPAAAIRSRRDSPIVRGIRDQKAGRVQAFVSAGSTGAVVAASLLILGRLPGIDRPAIAAAIPTTAAHTLLLDVGANVHCTPEHLYSFAEMGDLFCREILGVARPRVGLLNIGEEQGKGTELVQAAYQLLARGTFEFVGNIESNKLLQQAADVVVTDGFTGNIVLKLVEGLVLFLRGLAAGDRLPPERRGLVAKGLAALDDCLDYATYGGALLLGVAGISVIGHGRSSSQAIASAIRVARRQAVRGIPTKLAASIAGRI
jgi:glycerol-3-phosphate acyltransferase PlsX